MPKYLPAVALACALVACSESTPPRPAPAPTSIQQLHKDIVAVHPGDKDEATEIIIARKTVWNEASVVFSLADIALEVVAGMQGNGLMPASERIRFTIAVPFQDQYGNTKSERVIAATFLKEDLAKINVSNKHFLPQHLLNMFDCSPA